MEVRSYTESDADALAELFHAAVRHGATHKYGEQEVAAWSPDVPVGPAWAARLAHADTVVAEAKGDVLGFMSVDQQRYLDLAFVRPDVMGKGVSDALYAVLEGRARARGTECLTTQASLLAEPFFTRFGWNIVRRQEVEINGVLLKNAWMKKRLAA